MSLFTPLTLPNGAIIPNRLAKAAMEENMADRDQAPSDGLIRLYEAWAKGGVGLIITGNVMVDGRAMTGPGGVVLEDRRFLDRFKRWAAWLARVGRPFGCRSTIRADKCRRLWVSRPLPPRRWPWISAGFLNNFPSRRRWTRRKSWR